MQSALHTSRQVITKAGGKACAGANNPIGTRQATNRGDAPPNEEEKIIGSVGFRWASGAASAEIGSERPSYQRHCRAYCRSPGDFPTGALRVAARARAVHPPVVALARCVLYFMLISRME